MTEDREAFMPWLLWNFSKQTYAPRQLVLVDSSARSSVIASLTDGCTLGQLGGVITLGRASHRALVGSKYRQALNMADGDIVMLWGDDDWQHPQRIEWSVEALLANPAADAVGWNQAWFVELWKEQACQYGVGATTPVAALLAARMAPALEASFPDAAVASDTSWGLKFAKKTVCLTQGIPSLWLCHGGNMSERDFGWTHKLSAVKGLVGPEAWGDTSRELKQLRKRLKA